MKHNTTTKSLATLLLVASVTSLCAIERPVPARQPKEKPSAQIEPRDHLKPARRPHLAPDAKIVERPFLGVLGAPVSQAMATQMGLAEGIGLTLQHIARDTPADKAGLKKHDIITQMSGNDIGSQEQLRNAILKHKPNDKVEIKYISGGKAITKQVVLGSTNVQLKPMRGIAPRPQLRGAIPQEILNNLPPEQRHQLEQLLQGNLNNLDFRNLRNLDVDQLQRHFGGFQHHPKIELNFNDLMKNGGTNKTRMKMVDPKGSVTLETNGNKKTIELHAPDGKLLYKGPYNTKEDKLKIPENLRERTDKIQIPEVRIHRKAKQRNGNFPQGMGGLGLPQTLEEFMKQGHLQGFHFPRQRFQLPEDLKQLMQQGNALPGNKPQILPGAQMRKFEFNFNGNKGIMRSSSTITDPATGNRYSQKKNEDGKEIEITDKEGSLLYNGPLNTPSDYEMVPEDFRPFLKTLDNITLLKDGKLKLNLAPKK